MTGALCGMLLLAAGCGKKAESQPNPSSQGDVKKQVEPAAAGAKEAAQKVVGTAVSTTTQAVKTATAPAAGDNSAKVQALIDSAKKLVAEGKFQEVLQKLNELKGVQLTPDQEKALLGLKDQLEKMVKDAGAGGLLPK